MKLRSSILVLLLTLTACNDKMETSDSSNKETSVAIQKTTLKNNSARKRNISSVGNEKFAEVGDYYIKCFGHNPKDDYNSVPAARDANRVFGRDNIVVSSGFQNQPITVTIEKPYEIVNAYSSPKSEHCVLIKKL